VRELDERQKAEILSLLSEVPWGDVIGAISSVEEATQRGVEATQAWFPYWDEELEGVFTNEFEITPAKVECLTPDQRLAYAARLFEDQRLMLSCPSDAARADSALGALRGIIAILYPETAGQDLAPVPG